jgi:hypothetical protein
MEVLKVKGDLKKPSSGSIRGSPAICIISDIGYLIVNKQT